MLIEYNVPFEVNKKQYDALRSRFTGIVAHNSKDGKYFIRVWIMKYVKYIYLTLAELEDKTI